MPGQVNASATPNKYFVYDSATVNSVAMVNVKGRMAEAYTCFSPCSSKITDIGMSYTVRGEPSDVYESTPNSGGYYHVTESYWANGALDQLSNLVGLPTVTYGVDGEGRVYSVGASSGQNPLSSTSYNTASLPTAINLGSGDSDSYTFDPNTNRMTQYSFNVNGQSVVGALTWNPIGTLETLAVTDPFYSGGNQTCSYTHDDLTRIFTANCGSVFSQTFSYDAFGNLDKSGTISFQPSYSYLTNHITTVGNSPFVYDANGNTTNDLIHTYAYDAAGRPVTIDSVTLTYDALGRMVEQNRSGAYTQIVYGTHGGKLALMSGQTLQKAFVPLAGGAVAAYTSSGLLYYRHSDWLGSSRFASTPSRTMYSDGAYAPFGEPYADSGTSDSSFTGMNQDRVSGLYDFAAREYSTSGRWPSPDPFGMAAVSTKDPQTWNRYAYVRNSPLHAVDPTGLMMTMGYEGAFGGGGAIMGWLQQMMMQSVMGLMSEGGGGFGCTADGLDAPCGMVMSMLGGGGAVQCTNNDCGIGTATPFQCVGSVCGNMSNQYASTHENELNGQLYTDGQFNQFVNDAAEAQLEALTDAIDNASNDPDGSQWGAIYNSLVAVQTQGGNVDFSWDSTKSGLSLESLDLPDSLQISGGGCELTCRDGSIPSLHFNDSMFHLDSANPLWGFGLGAVLHLVGDVILGNINGTVPMNIGAQP